MLAPEPPDQDRGHHRLSGWTTALAAGAEDPFTATIPVSYAGTVLINTVEDRLRKARRALTKQLARRPLRTAQTGSRA
ncbi:hypothetical protein [Halosaccharopolyspora lacisalsi]|uniref:hypothetical protein n=1 Tax=Halosaccharopolyspora lacisalsi TaxID=1000566 RepID=UPI0015FDDE81|nr:hypothetical protein [Halosaccharopolyspora lacisalsi]